LLENIGTKIFIEKYKLLLDKYIFIWYIIGEDKNNTPHKKKGRLSWQRLKQPTSTSKPFGSMFTDAATATYSTS
jgi:hypothetical protein